MKDPDHMPTVFRMSAEARDDERRDTIFAAVVFIVTVSIGGALAAYLIYIAGGLS